MAIHKDLSAAECHEDILIIPAGTIDSGKVITPSSSTAGEGELRQLNCSEILNTPLDFGNMVITNNTTIQSLTIAVDTTFNTNTDYASITPAFWAGEFNSDGITFASGQLTVSKPGMYLITGFLSLKSSVNNTRAALKGLVNGTTFTPRKIQNEAPSTSAETNFAGSILALLAVNDTIEFAIAVDKTCDITINDANIDMIMIRNDT